MFTNELLRIGRKPILKGQVALTRDSNGKLQRVKIEGVTGDGNHLYGQGQYLAVRLYGRAWRLQTVLNMK